MTDKVREQILAIRETGLTNMFDTHAVQRLGLERGYYDVVIFIEENKSEYVNFIFFGKQTKTLFEKDYAAVMEDEDVEVLRRRQSELVQLHKELRSCKNSFRAKCILQEITKLKKELEILDELL